MMKYVEGLFVRCLLTLSAGNFFNRSSRVHLPLERNSKFHDGKEKEM
jgi:hypothetical protein